MVKCKITPKAKQSLNHLHSNETSPYNPSHTDIEVIVVIVGLESDTDRRQDGRRAHFTLHKHLALLSAIS